VTTSDPFWLVRQPFSLGRVRLRNRIFQSAHTTNFGASDRSGPTPRHIAYHRERARGGVALIITEGIRIYAPTWRKGRMGAFSDDALPDFRQLTEAVHAEGAAIFAQLNDPGRHLRLDRIAPVSASALPWTHAGAVPHVLTPEEIGVVVRSFGDAANRMERGRFDGIEVQCGHGHLINQFLSPATNRRDDAYGGDATRRRRFLMEVFAEVCARTELPVGIRLSAEEFLDDGLRLADSLDLVAQVKERFPLAFAHVTQSFYDGSPSLATQLPDMAWPAAPFRHLPKAFKEAFPDLPVLAICRMDDLRVAQEVLADGVADLVGMARPQIAEPNLVAKTLGGREHESRHCIACNQGCIGRSESGSPISCVVNPRVGLEREFALIDALPVRAPARVAVVGGGPAGLQAALSAARRGHQVTLYESRAELGGQIRTVSTLAGRERFALLVDELERDVRAAGVEVRCGAPASPTTLGDDVDTVLIATGAAPATMAVPGARRVWPLAEAALAVDALGGHVLIVDEDGGWPTGTVAEHLGRRGIAVDIVTADASFLPNVTVYSRVALVDRLQRLPVGVRLLQQLVRMEDDEAVLRDRMTGASSRVAGVSSVVASLPSVANDRLARELVTSGFAGKVHIIGDAYAPRTALEAVYEGHVAAVSIGHEHDPTLQALPTYRPPISLPKRKEQPRWTS